MDPTDNPNITDSASPYEGLLGDALEQAKQEYERELLGPIGNIDMMPYRHSSLLEHKETPDPDVNKAFQMNLANAKMAEGMRSPDPFESYDNIEGIGGIPYPKPVFDALGGFGAGFNFLGERLRYLKQTYLSTIPGIDNLEDPKEFAKAFIFSPIGTVYRALGGGMSAEEYAKHAQRVSDEWHYYRSTPYGQSWNSLIGEVGAEVIATAPVPLSLGGKPLQAMFTGAAFGAGTTGAVTYVPEGESSIPYVALGGVLGGALAGGYAWAGARLASKLAEKAKYGGLRPLEEKDIISIQESLKKLDPNAAPEELAIPGGMTPKEFANAINTELFDVSTVVEKGQAVEKVVVRRGVVDTDFTLHALRQFPANAKNAKTQDIEFQRRVLNTLATDKNMEVADWVDFVAGDANIARLHQRAVARGQVGGVDSLIPDSQWKDIVSGRLTLTAARDQARRAAHEQLISNAELDEISQALSDLDEMEWGIYRSPADKGLDELGIPGVASEKELTRLRLAQADRVGLKGSNAFVTTEGLVDLARKNKYADSAWDKYHAAKLSNSPEEVKSAEAAWRKADIEAREARLLFDKEAEARAKTRATQEAAGRKTTKSLEDAAAKAARQEPYARVTDDDVGDAFEALVERDAWKASRADDRARNKAMVASKEEQALKNLMKQGGAIDSQLLGHIARFGVGGGAGYLSNEENPIQGAIYGALLLGGGWMAAKRLGKKLLAKKLEDRADQLRLTGTAREAAIRSGKKVYEMRAAWWYEYPRTVMRSLGKPGRFLADQIEAARTDAEIRIGKTLTHTRQKLIEEGIIQPEKGSNITGRFKNVQGDLLRSYMQGELPNAPANVKRAGEYLRKNFREILDDAESVGLFQPEVAKTLRTKLMTKGYWPRVYDRVMLSTVEGKERFINALVSEGFNQGDMIAVLKSLLGDDSKYIAQFLDMGKNGDTFIVTREMALKLLNRYSTRAFIGRSTHLEHARTFNVKAEQLLNPFMISDPMAALTHYMDDAMRRIEGARRFGADDYHAERAAQEIGETYGPREKDTALQFYYHNVGDPRAASIQAAMNLSDDVAQVLGSASAWANMHLVFAQFLNLAQAGIVGTRRNAKHGLAGFKAVAQGLGDMVTNRNLRMTPGGAEIPARQWASETGADLEVAMLQHIGELTAMNHYLFGNKATDAIHNIGAMKGTYNPVKAIFDTLNNPSKFLRVTGFIKVEEFQRKWAALTGARLAKHLLTEAEAMRSAGVKSSDKKYKKVVQTLSELGLTTETGKAISLGSMTEDDVYRAGLRFSNLVNYRNTPDMIPLMLQHPMAGPFKRFKTFAYHTMKDIESIVRNKDTAGALTYLTTAGVVGIPLYDARERIKSVFTGRELDYLNEQTLAEKYFKGLATVGGFGLFVDLLSQTASPGGAAGTILGPAISDALDLTGGFIGSVYNYDKQKMEFNPGNLAETFAKTAPVPLSAPFSKATELVTGTDPRRPKAENKGTASNSPFKRPKYKRYSGM